jgi:hypothetical protein
MELAVHMNNRDELSLATALTRSVFPEDSKKRKSTKITIRTKKCLTDNINNK